MGIDRRNVVSPTFTLCNEYATDDLTIYHLDLYRIRDEDELFELGFDEYCNSPNLCLVEWSDRFPANMPADLVEIQIDVLSENSRQFRITGINLGDASP